MYRRLITAVALAACASVYVLAAERATFILTDGERKSGPVVFHGDQHENLINGYLNLGVDGGKDLTFPVGQVAVIDFVGGTPASPELAQLGSGHMLVMRGGGTQQGRFINLIGGETLMWENQAGQRQQFAIRDVTRVYLNPQSARTAFNYTPPPVVADNAGASGNSSNSGNNSGNAGNTTRSRGNPNGSTNSGNARSSGTARDSRNGQRGPDATIRVQAMQEWTDTGLVVNEGDRVVFEASGQIQYASGADHTSTPDGNPGEQRARKPESSLPVGALMGRIGNRAPFGIGTQTQPLVMPASGRLMLGVNDSDRSDNGGYFTVNVTIE